MKQTYLCILAFFFEVPHFFTRIEMLKNNDELKVESIIQAILEATL